jgi:hypothetical protein
MEMGADGFLGGTGGGGGFCLLTVTALFGVRQALQDPHNALVSWDVNYLSPCTFMWVQCSAQQVVTSM